jgi:hypothetical protein
MSNYERVCLCLQLRCRDCGWEGDQVKASLHWRLNPDCLPVDVTVPACGETPCRTAAAIQEQRVTVQPG